jgi:hypothetical protein
MGENDTTKAGEDPSNGQELRFTYVKSNFFRVIHADGAWGGISPRGDIHVSFYNERGALPDSSILTLGADGKPLKPEEAQSSGTIIREIECDVVLDLAAATGLRKWLEDNINELNRVIKEARDQQKQNNQKSLKEPSAKVRIS